MKYIVAVIRPSALEKVTDALKEIGIGGMVVSEVKGYGRQSGHSEIYRGRTQEVIYIPKLKVEIALSEELAADALAAIREAACSGQVGDGKIFVFDLQDCIRIRTGEDGVEAL